MAAKKSNVKTVAASTPQSAVHSLEELMATELGLDPSILNKDHGGGKHFNIEKLLRNGKGTTPGERKRELAYEEDIIAAAYMRNLTHKYGNKGKSAKQYFMEAYDDDTRAGLGRVDEEKIHHYDARGREILHPNVNKAVEPPAAIGPMTNGRPLRNDPPCSPIVFKSADELLGDDDEQQMQKNKSADKEPSEVNFWASLDNLEKEAGGLSESELSWCPSTADPPHIEELLSRKKFAEDKPEDSSWFSSWGESKYTLKEADLDKYLLPVQEVVKSASVKLAWVQVVQHLEHFNVKDPIAYEMYGNAYEETRDFIKLPEDDVEEFEGGNWEPIPIKDDDIFEMEPPEKLFGRYCVYQNALLHMIEHFETLRPLLSEIKQSYTEVLDKCEKEWKDLDKLRLEQLRLKEVYAEYVRKRDRDGDRALMEVKLQSHALQEHLQWQQHTLHTILGVLSKMRHSLKMQSKAVEKTTTMYKNKVDLLAKEIVSQQGQALYETSLPGKYTELMAKFKSIKDPKELRRILQAARRQLRKAHKQIVIYEADYTEF